MSTTALSHPVLLHSNRAGATGGFGAADPFAAGRSLLWSGEQAMAAGHVAWTGGRLEIAAYPFTELLIVDSGVLMLALTGNGDSEGDAVTELTLEPGQAAVLPRGGVVVLAAGAPVVWRFCAAQAAQGSAPAPAGIAIEPVCALAPSAAPATELLRGPTPSCRSLTQFADAATDLRIGVWDSTPYDRRIVPHRMNELMHILEGTVELTAADGTMVQASAGDTVFVPRGMPCAWTSTVTVRKIYAVQG